MKIKETVTVRYENADATVGGCLTGVIADMGADHFILKQGYDTATVIYYDEIVDFKVIKKYTKPEVKHGAGMKIGSLRS